MPKYSCFAVVGAGYIGLHVIKALLQRKASVVVLTSSSSKYIPDGVKTAHVKYSDIATITRVLQENRVEVVISTLSTDGLSAQNNVAEASKGASVKLFLPSEFGIPTEGSKLGVFAAKDKSASEEIFVSDSTSFLTGRQIGFVTEMLPDLVGMKSNGKVNILSKLEGKTPISFTSIDDTADFVAFVLTSLHPDHLDYSTFRIQGQSASLIEVASILGTTVEQVTEIPSPAFKPAGFFQEYFETGAGTTGWDAEEDREGADKAGSSNSLWEDHRWKSIRDILQK
ncbi:hypothetical protein H0H87_009717 [Tephrocybe sp. NHM501043]|nr:hypothetical protein H0H87_009717 [Tephrocybe sp. NHM501043]